MLRNNEKKFWQISVLVFKQKLSSLIEYRVNFLLQIISGFLALIFSVAVWQGLRPHDFRTTIWTFYVLVGVIGSFNGVTFYRQMSADINSGQLSFYLLQPFPYFLRMIIQMSADSLINFIISILVISVTGFYTREIIQFTLPNFIFALPFLVLGWLVGMLVNFLFGCVSFIWINPDAFYLVLDVVLSFLFGAALPFWLFPRSWQNLFRILPFRLVIATPVEIALGMKENLRLSLVSSLVWIGILSFICRRIWRKILVYYEAVGG